MVEQRGGERVKVTVTVACGVAKLRKRSPEQKLTLSYVPPPIN
jgi:hypothetical protein